jgi:hypothetical protein
MNNHVETSPVKSRSNYTFRLIESERRIHINDYCNELGGMSVTNNAENVVAEIDSIMPIFGLTISYTDTMGQTDELLHDGKLFSGFAPGRGRW